MSSAIFETGLRVARALGAFELARRLSARRVRILAYHGAWITPGIPAYGDKVFMPIDQFERRMARLRATGYRIVPLEQAVAALAADRVAPNTVVVTVDDGWASTYTHMLPVLEHYEIPATVYVTTWYVQNRLPVLNKAIDYVCRRSAAQAVDWDGKRYDIASPAQCEATALALEAAFSRFDVGERNERLRALCRLLRVSTEPWWSNGQFHLMSSDQLADMARRGIDIGMHTHRHIDVDRHIDRLATETRENRAVLTAIAGPSAADHFCYPSGGYHPQAPRILASLGVASATLCDMGLNAPGCDPYRLNRFLDGRLTEQVRVDAYLSGFDMLARRLISAARR